jgi:flagellar hook-associated protein 2
MAQGITFSGLGSGLDTDSIIEQLMAIERRPINLIQNRQVRLESQKSVIQSINSNLLSLKGAVDELADEDLFSIVNAQSDDSGRVAVQAGIDASPGTFSVEVEQLAQARSLSSRSFATLGEGLELEGEFVINGQAIQVSAEHALVDISAAINEADAGVSAQILTVSDTDNRLILTADKAGSDGFDLKDTSSTSLLQSLGLTSGEKLVKHSFVSGGASDQFLAADEAVGSLLNLGTAPAAAVLIGGDEVEIDLTADSLNDIRDKINAAGISDVTASVVSSDEGGLTRYSLEIDGTTSFIDGSGVLETLNLLNGSGAVANEIIGGSQSDAFASTTTTVGALLGLGTAPTGSISIGGQAIAVDLSADSLTDVQTRINDAGIAGVNAVITSDTDEDGNALFRLRIDGSAELEDDGNVLEALGVVVGSNRAFENVAQNLTGNVANLAKGAVLNPIGGGAKSAALSSSTDAAGALLGSTAAATVRIGDKDVAIDLATDSISDIRDKINAAAPTGVVASINVAGPSSFELSIAGSTDFDDAGGVLEALGVVGAPSVLTADTAFNQIAGAGAAGGDTVSIGGTDRDGNQIAGTFTLGDPSQTVQDLLDEIESLFGGGVNAAVDASGRIVVADGQAGASQLSLNLQANNQGGGGLNFGDLAVTTEGREARSSELQEAQDASLRINGIALTRSSNNITDAVQGVTLDLLQAEVGEVVNITVTRDDTTELRQKISDFVTQFNTSMSLINDQFVFDENAQRAGPLSGDSTILTLQSRLRSIVSGQVDGLSEGFDALVLIGVNFDRTGNLTIDNDALNTALTENLDDVRKLFVAQGTTNNEQVDFISSNAKTRAGNYSVQLSQAAERANLLGSIELDGGLEEDEDLTITDTAGRSASVSLSAGDTLAQSVTKINAQLASDVAEVRRATLANTSDGVAAVTRDSSFAAIFGAGAQDGDTIRINGTDHGGVSVSSTFLISDAEERTVGDLLDAVRNTFGGRVSAAIDAEGRIVVTDNQVGTSALTVTLIEENEGGGSLDFGSIDVETEGRLGMDIKAANRDGRLELEHSSYGSRNGFSVSGSVGQFGLGDGEEISGTDAEGTINGEEADGFGRILSGRVGSETVEGLSLRSNTTSEQLSEDGADSGSVSLIYGVARLLADELSFVTDKFDGSLQSKQDSIDRTIDDLDSQIASMERRVEQTRLNLVGKFAALEGSVATLQSQGNFLSSQLSGLSAG